MGANTEDSESVGQQTTWRTCDTSIQMCVAPACGSIIVRCPRPHSDGLITLPVHVPARLVGEVIGCGMTSFVSGAPVQPRPAGTIALPRICNESATSENTNSSDSLAGYYTTRHPGARLIVRLASGVDFRS